MWPIFKNDMFIYHLKANLDVQILFRTINHLLRPKIKEMPVKSIIRVENSTILSGP